MTFEEIATMIESIGLPYTYYSWNEDDTNNPVPDLPYIVFYYPNSNNFSADNTVYAEATSLNIELYSLNKDFELEKQVEDVLIANDLFWNKSESYINNEHMFEVLYQTEVLLKGANNG